MNNGVRIDSESVRMLSKQIVDETNKLLSMIDTVRSKVDDSVNYYDSPAAATFREKMNEFSENAKRDSQVVLTNLSNYFEAVAKTYEQLDQEVISVANEYLSTDIFA